MLEAIESDLLGKLKDVFGFNDFRGTQELIINNILDGHNTFVIMPTGAGKSLCYQLPALMKDGTAIVISPLIALMKNQVDQMQANGINAQFLNSSLSKSEIARVKSQTLDGEVKMLYVAPETLTKEENIAFLQNVDISLVAIDEAHCISEWGHDFRPEYRKIKTIIEQLGKNIPIIALTATATPKVQQDIQRNLQMEDAAVFKTSFNRSNLFYEVKPKLDDSSTYIELIKFVKNNPGKSGIIYCLSRKKVDEISELLRVNDIKALPYHAGLDSNVRMQNQDAFLKEDCGIIVATIAFGMGIDKPDVRFVVHFDTPKSIEGYYQETGRAGRDGLEGHCLMYYSHDDIVKLEKFNKDKTVAERDNAKSMLNDMAAFADTPICRRKQLLHYFGEYLENDCGYCDNCKKPKNNFQGMEEVLLALKAVQQTGQKFSANHIVDVLRGVTNEYVESHSHDDLDIFGEGDAKDADFWHNVLKQIIVKDLLVKDAENDDALKLTKKGESFIKKPQPITLVKEASEDDVKEEPVVVDAYDPALFSKLKAVRKKVAKEMELPPYVLFQDPSLEEMATTFPTTAEDLARVNGVGMGKVQKYGRPFLDVIIRYVKENDIITGKDITVKSTPNKSKLKVYIIQQIDRKIDLEEICEAKFLNPEDLIEEIENICFSGTKLNLDYYIDNIIDYKRQQEIVEYFMHAESDSIADALVEFDGEYTEEELRLMRVKFMSEVAN